MWVNLTVRVRVFKISKQVPEWVKKNVKLWIDDQIDDSTFTAGIGFLIQEKIVDIDVLPNVSKEKNDDEIQNDDIQT